MFLKPFRGARLNRTHPLARGLVACYLMNEGVGNQIFDIAGNHNGIFAGDTTWIAGRDGPVLTFDGAGDYVDVGTFPGLDFATSHFSITAWIYHASVFASTWPGIFLVSPSFEMTFGIDQTSDKIEIWTNNVNNAFSNSAIPANVWSFIGLTYDQTTFRFYINGQPDGTSVIASPAGAEATAYIGGLGVANTYFNGLIGEVSIRNRVLSTPEMAQLHRELYAFIERPQSRGALFEEIVAVGIVPILEHHYRMMRNQ